ncbi:hypothetical protein KY290_024904 [Solanum tuberosum]|uniref:Uncharacterized protein n=1 Tax=Solanum tuberosum TaxID=4113 RepID=A0ABQ7US04_SOLTU|nr:hypothetical protein KY290_024904 [Solanum tuberosum]
MAKTRGGSTKPSAHIASSIKKRKAEEVLKTCKKKKIAVEEFKFDSKMEIMAEIDNYQDSSPNESDNVKSSEGESDSEESSRNTSRDEEDPLSLPICARDISGELYDLATWLNEIRSFPAKISVWIYEAFPYLGEYVGKSLDTPLPIPHLLRWYTSKSDSIVEGDPFKYKGRSTKFVHPYLTPTVRVMEQNYMATYKPYKDEVKDAVIDVLKAQLKGVTVIISGVESASNEYLAFDEDFAAIDEYLTDEVNEVEVDGVDKVTNDHIDEVAGDRADEVAVDAVAVDEVVVDVVAVDLVDEVGVVVVDEVAGAVDPVAVNVEEVTIDEVAVDIVNEVAGAVDLVVANIIDEVAGDEVEGVVDPVAANVIDEVASDEVAGVVDPVTADVIDEVASGEVVGVVDIVDEVAADAIDEVAEEKKEEENVKEKSVDDGEEKEEDDSVENSVDVMSIVMDLNGEINGDKKNN